MAARKKAKKTIGKKRVQAQGRGIFSFSLSAKERRFLALFLISFVVLYALIHILPLQFLDVFVANAEASILSSAGHAAVTQGTTLFVGKAAFEIVVDCSGLVMMIMFFSLLYSTGVKITWQKLLKYFAFFFVFNLIRLAFTLAVSADYGNAALDVVHPVLWFVDSGVVFAAWAKEYGLW